MNSANKTYTLSCKYSKSDIANIINYTIGIETT